MPEIVVDETLVACCGLYCAACGSHLKGRCPGCRENEKAAWCKVRLCCIEKGIASCAECAACADPKECAKFNNFISRAIGLLLNSSRAACIARIRQIGTKAYASEMAAKRLHHLPRRGKR